jgi:chromosome segregation ATPase
MPDNCYEGEMSETEGFEIQFRAIEEKVERLVAISKHLQEANAELQHKIRQLEEELHRKNESVKRLDEEKAFIRSRIDNLLAKLEGVTRG